MIECKVFEPESLFVSFILDSWHTEPNQFSSVVLYGTITISNREGRNQSHPLVLKFKHTTPQKRKFCRNDQQFHNEKLFYEEIAPFLLAFGSQRDGDYFTAPSLCRYFYERNDCSDLVDRDRIVLENETIQWFHSLSFKAKHVNLVEFNELVAKMMDAQWTAEGEWYLSSKGLEGLFSNGLDTLVESKSRYDKQAKMFRTELSADAAKTLKRVMKPDEPLSVLCHGDFGRQNLLFRYDDDGRPLDALAYVMALVRYGSPALDLSYFMYLNTDRQTRDDHWDELLDVYCETLASVAGSALVPDRSQLDAEMRKHAYYGLAFVSLASRLVLEGQFNLSRLVGFTDDETLQIWLSCGGKRATEWTVDVCTTLFGHGVH